jgi:ribonuclease J
LVPVHGEDHHILEQADLGLAQGIPYAIPPRNGDLIILGEEGPELVDQVFTGRLALDGKRLIPYQGTVMHDRHRLMSTGHALVTLLLKKNALKNPPSVLLIGITEGDNLQNLTNQCIVAIEEMFLTLPMEDREDDEAVSNMGRIATRRVLANYNGKKTMTHVQVYRV